MKRFIRIMLRSSFIRKYATLLLMTVIVIIGIKTTLSRGQLHTEVANNETGEVDRDISSDSELIYQYPIEIGYSVDSNYNGKGAPIDYFKRTCETTVGDVTAEGSVGENDSEAASKPSMLIDDEDYRKLHTSFGDICCTNVSELNFKFVNDSVSGNSTIKKAAIMYGNHIGYIVDDFDNAKYVISDNFYGKLTYSCVDEEGNASDLNSEYFLVENSVPGITITEGDEYESPNSINVEITDKGKIVSGIFEESIECYVNDKKYDPKNIKSIKSCRLADNLEVSTDSTFTITFSKDGTYYIDIVASDNCGNTARFKYNVSVIDNKAIIS